MIKRSEKSYLELWDEFKANMGRSKPVDLNETPSQRKKRREKLEANPEEWNKYYLADFCTSEPATWQVAASRRIFKNPEWFEVRSWSRELAKSTRAMAEVLYLTLTGKKHNVLLVSNSYDNAERLLLPYKMQLELNPRIIADYGVQQSLGKWEAGEFTTKKGVSFRALGAGQSPRGTKNDAKRPDTIIIDDIDTDAECLNKKRIKKKVKWIFEALIPTRSVSEPLLLLVCGNIIAKYCCVTELAKKADKHEIINLEDKNGNSTWPQKNKPENIARIKQMTPWSAYQKEYCNNPTSEGDTFKEITYGKAPKISSCEIVLAYSDPSTSNKDKSQGASKGVSHKSVVVIGFKAMHFYVYWVRLDQTSNSKFVDWLFEAEIYMVEENVDPRRVYIENNSLQDPFYQQVIKPLITEKNKADGVHLPIIPDSRKKPDKFFRVEGTLEPLNRNGYLIFDEKIRGNPHMVRMEEQMLGVSEDAQVLDGPDALEGGVWIIKSRTAKKTTTHRVGKRQNMKF